MKLINKKIGEFVEQYSEKCNIPNLTIYDVSGVNKEKEFFEPSQQVGKDTSNYKIVPPGYFACNLMHVGRDIVLPISLNTTEKNKIVSPAYFVFYISHEEIILKEFFFIYLNSIEKDRFFWFHTDSSVRDGLSWEDFCDLEITIPPIEVQREYVYIYNSLLKNQQAYEKGKENLRLIYNAYMENLKNTNEIDMINKYCTLSDERNISEECDNVRGLTVYKKFIDTKADMNGVSLKNYKVVQPGDIAYVPTTNRNGDKIACGIADEECIVSSTYEVIKINNKYLNPKYLFMWFERTEMDRYARYNSWGSARETIEWEELGAYRIPIPSLEIQQDIVNIYEAYNKRKNIAERLKEQIKNICPVLIAGAIKEGEKANG